MENQDQSATANDIDQVSATTVVADSAGVAEEVKVPEQLVEEPVPGNDLPEIGTRPPEEEVKEVRVTLKPRPPLNNAEMETNPLLEKLARDLNRNLPMLALPPESEARVREIIDQIPKIDLGKDGSARRWFATLTSSLKNLYDDDSLEGAASRDGAQWRQYLEHAGNKLSIGAIKLGATEGEKLTGNRAVMQIKALMGGGTPRQIPMPHTGMWVTMKAPGDMDTVDLYRRLAEEKIDLGRQTYGLAFSNVSSFFTGAVTNFAFDMVYDHSLRENDVDLGDVLLVLDLPILAWGAVATMWPNGFNYTRAVLNDSGTKTATRSGTIAINKLFWADNREFSDWQRAHMSQRFGKNMTKDNLKKYRDDFVRIKDRTVPLNDFVTLELRVPTVNQYLNAGQRWVNGIVTMVDKAFAQPPSDDARNTFINTQGKATNLRQFAGWIKAIHANGTIYDDMETIEEALDMLSEMDEVADLYMKEVRKYIEDCTLAMIAIPVEEGEVPPETEVNSRYPHLLPIDVFHTFFTLLVQRVEQINAR